MPPLEMPGPKGVRFQPPVEGWNQNKQRGLGLFFDQHRHPTKFPDGRPWWCVTERPADGAALPMPVGELIPYGGWTAPWIPEAKYMQMSMGTLQTNRFTIMYERMITDYRQAWDEYYQRAAGEAAVLNLPIPDHGDAITWKLKAIVGQPPRTPRIAEAALAGDQWLLGFTDEKNEYIERLLYSGDLRIGRAVEIPIEQLINRTKILAEDEADLPPAPPPRPGRKSVAVG